MRRGLCQVRRSLAKALAVRQGELPGSGPGLAGDQASAGLDAVGPASRRLVGIISRTDILAVFDRTDAEIRDEIMTQVIAGRSEPSQYSVIVTDGVVTLEGNPETVAIGHDLVARTRHVQGVVAVRDRLVYPAPPGPSRVGPYF